MRPRIFDLLFNDDRMFVLELSPVITRGSASNQQERNEWAVITRRNVPDYPVHRCDSFFTREEALRFYEKIVVETPRVSLAKKSPIPSPTLEEYKNWLASERLYDPILNPSAEIKRDA